MSEQQSFDVVVVGGGPAGYHAAIRAAQLGLKVACVDAALGKDGKPALGGTCLRVGCIPSKALLDSSRQFWNMGHLFDQHGISFEKPAMDVPKMVARKDGIVKQFTGGIAALFKANKVASFSGFGTLQPGNVVSVKQHDDSVVELKGTNVILAPGSDSIELPFAKFDGKHIVDNVGALDFEAVPKTLGVIGAGVIGLELGSVWNRLGSKVTVLEGMPDFLAAADKEVAKVAAREFKKQGLDIRLGTKCTNVEVRNDGVHVSYTDAKGESQSLVVEKLLVAVGRRAATTTTTSGLKYDAIADQYIYNWKTASSLANTCQMLDLKLTDGTHHYAFFKFTWSLRQFNYVAIMIGAAPPPDPGAAPRFHPLLRVQAENVPHVGDPPPRGRAQRDVKGLPLFRALRRSHDGVRRVLQLGDRLS